jgi:integrase/recombinase XerD
VPRQWVANECLLFRMRNRRHTTATHLLRAGVDINTIRAWLGPVSIDTTNIYAETDLEMKAKALATCEVKETERSRRWKEDRRLMSSCARSEP